MQACDILLFGTGGFAQRIACDLAATASAPLELHCAGRNRLRLAWIKTAATARADMFARPARVTTHVLDLSASGVAELLARLRPAVIVQAASLQTAQVIAADGNAWSRLVRDGGLSATAVFQAVLTSRIARAVAAASPESRLLNCCFPDVVNGIIAAMGLAVECGVGNIAILAHAFSGALEGAPKPKLQMLCHYQNLAAWRRPAEQRLPPGARVWLEGREVDDVFARFTAVQLTPEPVIDISGASGVTLALALAHQRDWSGHAPGPHGLPGGYPVAWRGGRLELDLPAAIDRDAAIAWNAGFEEANGLVIDAGGRARYTGRLHEMLREESRDLAAPFQVADLEDVCRAMAALRGALQQRP